MSAEPLTVDYLARLADAWDGRGHKTFRPPDEHRALLDLAYLQPELAHIRWSELSANQRHALVYAARRAIELGRQCAWVFGEGQGARF